MIPEKFLCRQITHQKHLMTPKTRESKAEIVYPHQKLPICKQKTQLTTGQRKQVILLSGKTCFGLLESLRLNTKSDINQFNKCKTQCLLWL